MCSDSCEFCLIRIFSAFLHVTSPSYSRHWRCEVSKRPIFRLRLAFVWLHWTVKTNEICIINKYTHTHARAECKRARQSEWIQNLFHGQGRCRTMPKYGIFSFSIQIAFDLYLSKNIHRHFRMLFISFAHAPRSFRRLHPQFRLSVSCFTSIFGTHNNRKIIFVCFESYSRQYTLDHLKKKIWMPKESIKFASAEWMWQLHRSLTTIFFSFISLWPFIRFFSAALRTGKRESIAASRWNANCFANAKTMRWMDAMILLPRQSIWS